MPRITISVTLPSPLAITRHPSTTVRRNGSVLGQALCSDSVFTFSGCLAASHILVAAPSDNPGTWARSTPIAYMNAATSSANSSVVYAPSGLLVWPAPRRSTEMQVKCLA